jgi:hypothetical protein
MDRSSSAANLRRHKRAWVLDQIAVQQASERYVIELLDLSSSGARFRANRKIPVNTAIQMIIDFFPVDFSVRALVVWNKLVDDVTSDYDHGAEFINLPQEEGHLINEYVRIILQEHKALEEGM